MGSHQVSIKRSSQIKLRSSGVTFKLSLLDLGDVKEEKKPEEQWSKNHLCWFETLSALLGLKDIFTKKYVHKNFTFLCPVQILFLQMVHQMKRKIRISLHTKVSYGLSVVVLITNLTFCILAHPHDCCLIAFRF